MIFVLLLVAALCFGSGCYFGFRNTGALLATLPNDPRHGIRLAVCAVGCFTLPFLAWWAVVFMAGFLYLSAASGDNLPLLGSLLAAIVAGAALHYAGRCLLGGGRLAHGMWTAVRP